MKLSEALKNLRNPTLTKITLSGELLINDSTQWYTSRLYLRLYYAHFFGYYTHTYETSSDVSGNCERDVVNQFINDDSLWNEVRESTVIDFTGAPKATHETLKQLIAIRRGREYTPKIEDNETAKDNSSYSADYINSIPLQQLQEPGESESKDREEPLDDIYYIK